jgi:outer membrane protein assembly factor BamB
MLCATEERIIVGETSQSGEGGRVLAINAENGSVAWEHSVSDLPLHMPGEKTRGGVPGTAAVYKGILVVVVPKDFVVGLSVETGERLWTWTSDLSSAVSDAGSCFYSGRFYQLGSNGSYHIIDPHHGDTVFEIMLKARLPEKLRTVWGWKPSLVSETHLFVGSNDGHVLGFDRETGDYVWSILPKGGSAVARFSCASRRLYYADLGGRLHCLAPRPS